VSTTRLLLAVLAAALAVGALASSAFALPPVVGAPSTFASPTDMPSSPSVFAVGTGDFNGTAGRTWSCSTVAG
jgi:hypothetical protein